MRIVCNTWGLGGMDPVDTIEVLEGEEEGEGVEGTTAGCGATTTISLYTMGDCGGGGD